MKLFERSLFYTRVRNDQNQIVRLEQRRLGEPVSLSPMPVLPVDPQSSFDGTAYAHVVRQQRRGRAPSRPIRSC